jgi:hypothetical protein
MITFPNIGSPTNFGLHMLCYFVLAHPQKKLARQSSFNIRVRASQMLAHPQILVAYALLLCFGSPTKSWHVTAVSTFK